MADETLEQIERLVLGAMCQGTPEGPLRAEAARLLADYRWRETVHQAIFACLASVPAVECEELRRALLGCLTRKGFPDVELEILFQPHGVSKDESLQLIQRLIETR